MEAKIKIQKWNNNLGISIPHLIAAELSLREGLYVNIHDKNDRIIIEPIRSNKPYNLIEMLDKITDDNIHQTIDTGTPIGNEIW